jgi:hypothetical protein
MPADLTDVGAPDEFLLASARAQWRELTPNHWKSGAGQRELATIGEE